MYYTEHIAARIDGIRQHCAKCGKVLQVLRSPDDSPWTSGLRIYVPSVHRYRPTQFAPLNVTINECAAKP
jgi:hypothetical protein